MVKLLNPPTPHTPLPTRSSLLVDDQERRICDEIEQLKRDIRRIGPTHPEPSPHVLFGELFDDEFVEQYYEALVGTLKSAKKRGVISFQGQMLLKGMHDKVVISIVDEAGGPAGPTTQVQTKRGSRTSVGGGKAKVWRRPQSQPPLPDAATAGGEQRRGSRASIARANSRVMDARSLMKGDIVPSENNTAPSAGTTTPKENATTDRFPPNNMQETNIQSPNNTTSQHHQSNRRSTSRSPPNLQQQTGTNRPPTFTFNSPEVQRYNEAKESASKMLVGSGGGAGDGHRQSFGSSPEVRSPGGGGVVVRGSSSLTSSSSPAASERSVAVDGGGCYDEKKVDPPPVSERRTTPRSLVAGGADVYSGGNSPSEKKSDLSVRSPRLLPYSPAGSALSGGGAPTPKINNNNNKAGRLDNHLSPTGSGSKSRLTSPKTSNATAAGSRNNVGSTIDPPDQRHQHHHRRSTSNESDSDNISVSTVPSQFMRHPPRAPKPIDPSPPSENRHTASAGLAFQSRELSDQLSNRIDKEITQLLMDIRRVGSDPGEPYVTFGELFDDEFVQQYYEALVGTLKSAKRRGYVKFKGQMLLKGMHDGVLIEIVE